MVNLRLLTSFDGGTERSWACLSCCSWAGSDSAAGTGGRIADRSRKLHHRLIRILVLRPKTLRLLARQSHTSTVAPGQTTTSRSGDEEIKRLRERRIGAKPSESGEIIAAFEDAEKKYPNDYRFPYERAKLSIKGVTSHHEAFSALSVAAEKAIDNGKAQEMLDSLMADKDGDFYKVSRGHHEWQALVQALSNKDKRGLNELRH